MKSMCNSKSRVRIKFSQNTGMLTFEDILHGCFYEVTHRAEKS